MQSLLKRLAALRVALEVRDGKLHLSAPTGAMTPELREAIHQNREWLIEELQRSARSEVETELPRVVPDPAKRHEPFPLNDVQHAYWIGRSGHFELGGVSSRVYFELDGPALDADRLSAAFTRLLGLHDMLRAVVDVNGFQRVLETVPAYEIPVEDLRELDAQACELEVARIRGELAEGPTGSDRWPLFELRLLHLADDHSRLCVSWDFLVVDAWSLQIIFRQWHTLYENPGHELEAPGLSFRDYVLAAAELKRHPSYQTAMAYWHARIDHLPGPPQLPIVAAREDGRGHRFSRRRLKLPADAWARLKERGRSFGITPSSVLLAAFAEVLERWSKTPHFCLNLTLFNRLPLHEDVAEVVGDFTQLMVLEVDRRADGSFVHRARRIRDRLLEDFEHRQVSGVEVMRELARRRGWQNRAIFPVVFTSTLVLEGPAGERGGLERFGTFGYGISQTPQVWLDYQIFEIGGELVIHWDAVDEVFLPGVLDDMFAAHHELLEALADGEDRWQRTDVVLLPEDQRRLQEALAATADDTEATCLHTPFVETAVQHPERIALRWDGGRMSYGELLAQADAVAADLVEREVARGELVAVVMHRGWEQVAAVLGTLLAGAAYLPLDPRWPELRRQHLLEQGEVRVVLTQPEHVEGFDGPEGIEPIAVLRRQGLAVLTAEPPRRQTPEDLAYVIFTSGSTGTPKGVMIDHRGAVGTVASINRLFAVGERDRVLAVSELTFDLSVYDIFGPLTVGAAMVLLDPNRTRDPDHWRHLIRHEGVTIWNSAPQLMGMLVDAAGPDRSFEPLRLVLLSGDWIPVELPGRIRKSTPGAQVVSLGGATEGSIWSIYHPIAEVDPSWDSIPYGKALPNQQMYVLDHRLRPCPEEVTGGIFIGGRGVALGYWRAPRRTAESFVPHAETGERLYSTGDLGRLGRDGEIEFLGREDSQIKLRGYRVELGEIAATLRSHEGVEEAVVRLGGERKGAGSLSAYVVPSDREGALFQRLEIPQERVRELAAAVDRAGGVAEEEAKRADLERFLDLWNRLEELALRSMIETLRDLGVIGGGSAEAAIEDAAASGRVTAQHRRILEHWLDELTGRGLVRARGQGFEETEPADGAATVESELAALEGELGDDPRLADFLDYTAVCLRRRRELLDGSLSPLEILFPEGSWRFEEALYETTPIARHHNRVAAAVVRGLVDGWAGERGLRVLEIGAGIGATAAAVLPELPAERTEYWYTDISPFFFRGAQAKFAAYPFVRYGVFDIDRSPEIQGHQPHGYDLIVAGNVLHSSIDLRVCLERLRGLLRPEGFLVMVEGTRNTPWQFATVSFLEIVEAYADERGETGAPALGVDRWCRLLGETGFASVHAFPSPAAAPVELLEAMPQHVIAAQAPPACQRFAPDELVSHLSSRLPEYMVPQRYVLLQRLPLTPNGKIDLDALPEEISVAGAEEQPVVAAKSTLERQILEVWQETLGIHQIGITDNFFEAGGDSLLLIEVLRRLNRTQDEPLTTADLFAYPTIESLAQYLSRSPEEDARSPATAARPAAGPEPTEEIAVIGLAGRFPDAQDVEELWQNLAAGHCSVRRFSAEELLREGVGRRELDQEGYVMAGPVLEGIARFDAGFFGIPPSEAEVMDPQQRFLLECAVEALEHAGYAEESEGVRIGVFAGKGTSLYLLEHLIGRPEIIDRMGLITVLYLNEKDYAATLLSYKLDLTGPSVNINTACSTSLVAAHTACQSLLAGECEIALAGGVSFISTRERSGYRFREGSIMSPDGYCRAFSDDANGSVFGSGGGLVVLKPLAAALRDRDTIHAVIKGSAVNNDGSLKAGFTAPNVHGQAKALAAAYQRAGVSPDSVQLIEGHGTGTHLGDPIEFAALRQVFGGRAPEGEGCALGSVKTNIGHLDSAAGVAGLIKVVGALKRRKIPPTLHAEVPHRALRIEESPFYLNTEEVEWPSVAGPRRAGVSSFGVGGTNAHVVVEEAPQVAERKPARGPQILPLSAKSPRSWERRALDLAAELLRRPELALEDVAFTLQVGRSAHRFRSYVVGDDAAEISRRLAKAGDASRARRTGEQTPPVVFLLPGQGVPLRGVTRDLYAVHEVFRAAIDECAELVRQVADEDLLEWLDGDRGDASGSGPDIDGTAIVQPLLFSVEYALAKLWESLGVRPAAMLGHSLGEYVAACLAGVFELPEALSLMLIRGRMLEGLEPGRMLAIGCSEEEAHGLLKGSGVDLAAVNGDRQCTVSGPLEAIERLRERATAEGITVHELRTRRAFHSSMVEPVMATYEKCVAEIELHPPEIPFLSNVTGRWITAEEATSPAYWARHLRQPVHFADGVRTLAALEDPVMLEVGPGHTLTGLARSAGIDPDRVLPTLGFREASDDEPRAVLDAVGRLWCHGVEIEWQGLHRGHAPGRVPLPVYPFDHQVYWIERREVASPAAGAEASPTDAAEAAGLAAAEPVSIAAEPAGASSRGARTRPELDSEYVPPGDGLQTGLCEIWASCLGFTAVGIHDNFFELGGHSLLATQLVTAIAERLQRTLPLDELLSRPTVAEVAAYLVSEAAAPPSEALPALVPNPEAAARPFPMTAVQQAYWLGRSGAFELGNVATHSYFEFEIEGFDLERFEQAWNRLVERHGMLRAVFGEDGTQRILPTVERYRIACTDLQHHTREDQTAHLDRVRDAMSHQMLPADRWPLFEIQASRLSRERVRIHFDMDLLPCDASSFVIIFRELDRLYEDPGASLAELEISFRDYVIALASIDSTAAYQKARRYWEERLPTLPPAPELPLVADSLDIAQPGFERRHFVLESALWTSLRDHARKADVTPAVLLISVFSQVLAHWTRNPRFTLNLTLFNRLPVHEQVTSLVGDFTSLTLLELDNRSGETLRDLTARVQRQLWADLEHRFFDGVEVLRLLNRRSAVGKQTLMPVVFTSALGLDRREPGSEYGPLTQALSDLSAEGAFGVTQTPQVWLDSVVRESEGALIVTWDALEDLFPPGVLDALFAANKTALEGLATGGLEFERPLRLPLPAEQEAVRRAVNATEIDLPSGLLQDPFRRQAERRPWAPAVVQGERVLDFGTLDRAARSVARRLRAAGTSPRELVAIVMSKGWEQMVAALGTLYAGCAYLPIEASLPAERVSLLLGEGGIRRALAQEGSADGLAPSEGLEILVVGEADLADGSAAATERGADEAPAATPDDLAYVIFTSGSTGVPKGVMIDHRGAVNTILDINRRFGVDAEDRVLGLSAMGFDLSVYDLFGVLGAGGALVLPERSRQKEPAHWRELVVRHGITLWNSVPALAQLFVEELEGAGAGEGKGAGSTLRLALWSGDWIPLKLPDRWRAQCPRCETTSLGGATEASIWSIFHPIGEVDPRWSSIPYGKPLGNQSFHILRDDLSPCPDWAVGEIYIGGRGVALGYLGDEEKSRRSFVEHPSRGERLYRTGDLGRYWPDGTIEFLGREDSQVKVHGHRIELGEIEAALARAEGVAAAAVAAVGDRTERRLVAYVVPDVLVGSQGESVLGEETSTQGRLKSELERAAFTLRQPGLRAFPPSTEALPLFASEPSDRSASLRLCVEEGLPSAVPTTDAEIPEQRWGEWLACLRQIPVEPRPIPKRFYPSAGSLYPIQVYLYLREHAVEGLAAGFHYYDPVDHCLVPLPGADPETAAGGSGLQNGDRFGVFLVATREAMAPIYGALTERFCLLEAGHLLGVLAASAPANGIALRGALQPASRELHRALDLGDDQYLLTAWGGGPRETAPELAPTTLSLLARQSYRRFRDRPVGAAELATLLARGPETGLTIGVYMRPGAEGEAGGFFRFDRTEGKLSRLAPADEELVDALYLGPNRGLHGASFFSLYLVGEGQAGSDAETIAAGFFTQTLMEVAPELGLGLCPVGTLDFEPIRERLELPATSGLLYLLEGGAIAPEQTEVWPLEDEEGKWDPIEAVREHLERELPSYMVPTVIVPLERLPLTANGKVDRSALPTVDSMLLSPTSPTRPPQGELESVVAAHWSELLQLEEIGAEDNFFALGGDSLAAIRVMSAIRSDFPDEGEVVSLEAFFLEPTIAAVAAHIALSRDARRLEENRLAPHDGLRIEEGEI